jgi:phage shock protein A
LIAFFFPSEAAAAPDPDQIFQDAIVETRQKFLDLRATASPLYKARESLREEEKSRQLQIEDAGRRAGELLAAGREKDALRAAAEQGRLEPELEKIRRDLAELERPIAQVEAQLHRIEAKVRDLENERSTSRALLKGADARLAVERILSSGQLEAGAADITGAREIVAARLDRARAVEELSAESIEDGMKALEADLEGESARARLEAIRTLSLPPGKEDKE